MSGRGERGRGKARRRDAKKVTLTEALALSLGNDTKTLLMGAYALVAFAYVGCSMGLVGVSDGWTWSAFGGLGWEFYKKTADCFWMSLILVISIPLLSWSALHPPSHARPEFRESSPSLCECFRCYYCCPKDLSSGGYSALVTRPEQFNSQSIQTHSHDDAKGVAQPLLRAMHLKEGDAAIDMLAEEKEANDLAQRTEEDRARQSVQSVERWRDGHLVALFLASTGAQVYIGVKAISFPFSNESTEGALMGMGVAFVNLMVWLSREVINLYAVDEGDMLPKLHKHRLKLISAGYHGCDVCKLPCRNAGDDTYNCNICDWDCCIDCYKRAKRGDDSNREGEVRTDKGLRVSAGPPTLTGEKGYVRRCWELMRTEGLLFGVGMGFLLIGTLASLFAPSVQGKILDAVVTGNNQTFSTWILVYLVNAVGMGLVGGARSLCFGIIGRRLTITLKLRLFRGIIVQDVAFFDGNHSGDLSSRLSTDVWYLLQPINGMLSTIVSNSLLLVGGIAMCFFTSWRLSLLAFTTVGPIVAITNSYAEWSQAINRDIYTAVGRANAIAEEALSSIRTVKSCSTELFEQQRYWEMSADALQKGLLDAWVGAGMSMINRYLDLVSTVLILWYGGVLALRGEGGMTPGKLITFQLYFNMLNSSYSALLDVVSQLTRSAGAASRVFDLIDTLPDINLLAGERVPRDTIRGDISLRGVSFSYQMRPDKCVLKDISLDIPAGTVCALVGQSGGGKSTIVSLLMRFYDPVTGQVTLDGRDLRDLCLRDVRRSMGVVQQNTDLFAGTIYENICYGAIEEGQESEEERARALTPASEMVIPQLPGGAGICGIACCSNKNNNNNNNNNNSNNNRSNNSSKSSQAHMDSEHQSTSAASGAGKPTREMVIDAAKKACAHDFIMSFPDGYDTRIGERGIRISGGQKQRISIARAFLRRPKILLLDEATSALDAESEALVQEALDRLIKERGSTVLLVAHRLSTVINADKICVIKDGQIVEAGNHETLFATKGVYWSLVNRQLKKKAEILQEEGEGQEGAEE